MQLRLNHFIKPTTSAYAPVRILGIDAHGGYKDEGKDSAARLCTLATWNISVWDTDGRNRNETSLHTGTTQLAFWQEMRRAIKGKGVTWAIGFNTMHVLSLIGFWERLGSEKWTICEVSQDGSEESSSQQHRSFSGFMVTNDPPIIINVKPVGGSGILKIVDLRNYGITRKPQLEPGENMATFAGEFLSKVCELLQSKSLGSLQATGAAQAMSCYRQRYLQNPILVHNEQYILQLERSCLYAGRNECFRLGPMRGRIFHLDYNSFYPSIAAVMPIPCRLAGHGKRSVDGLVGLAKRGYHCIADVFIASQVPAYPYRHNGTTIYPVGAYRTQLCGPELDIALQCDHIVDVLYAAWYEADILFDKWATDIHAMRLECERNNNFPGAQLFKAMNNSLYGKFAQQSKGWKNMPDVEAITEYGQWWDRPPMTTSELEYERSNIGQQFPPRESDRSSYCRWRSIGWRTQVEQIVSESFNSCPIITAWLYSLARCKLLAAMGTCGWDNVYYVDTDSIWTNEQGYSQLYANHYLDDKELGKLKVVEECTEVIFHGLKHYETQTRTVHAGIPDDAAIVGTRKYEYRTTERLAAALQQGRGPMPISISRTIAYSPVYRHGRVDQYGDIHPWTIYKGVREDERERDYGELCSTVKPGALAPTEMADICPVKYCGQDMDESVQLLHEGSSNGSGVKPDAK